MNLQVPIPDDLSGRVGRRPAQAGEVELIAGEVVRTFCAWDCRIVVNKPVFYGLRFASK